jgi:DNA-binding transcriptional LysR family regulator
MEAMRMKHDLNLLRVLVSVADHPKVANAAQMLGMTQPGVSNALRRLRAAYSDELFVRTPRGMVPTPRALPLIEAAREMLHLHTTRMLGQPLFNPSTTETEFRLAMSDVGEMVFLPKLLELCRRQAPGAAFRSLSLAPEGLGSALADGTADLALGYFPDLSGENFFQQKLFSHGFSCLARADHPAIGKRLTRAQFLALEHAVVRAEWRSQEVFEQYLRSHHIERRVTLHVPHYMSIPFVIAESDLLVTVPVAVGIAFSALARLQLLSPPFDVPPYALKQHWHRRVHADPRNRWLRSQIEALFRGKGRESPTVQN